MFLRVARSEWDTLLVLCGVILCVSGIGGSLVSIGSAAGVAFMGRVQGRYTFFSHLRWTPVIALGFIVSVALHIWLNAGLF
ncbi:MAG: hypothetical protein B6D72_15005 [gamma proteobacterium symbiont of Ctena orbiculata]|nr:MAG: hypothetical protein B6D82_16980 [gamma proteobacterium symbiont of Ctena orbiculata]PVV09218.1 MAG: hypothetical protein B6D72_15005 [gamma proteobacterium symbiont of Ctena orbiculata]